MHGIYCFLHKVDDFDINYEQGFLNFDENNWYQELATVTDKGEVIPRCPEGDWRSRDNLQKEFLALPKEERWARAVQVAEDILKYEAVNALMLLGEKYKGKRDYESLAKALRKAIGEQALEASPFALEKAAEALSALTWRTGPFAEYFGNPYRSLRTYAHNVSIEEDDLAITFIDIHT